MKITDLTMNQFEKALAEHRVVVWPLGSIEEHGSHLPLDTDTMLAEEVVARAVAREPALVAPPLHYGYCRSTSDHPGTLSISPPTLRALMADVGASLHKQGARGLVVVSGHAGGIHMAALEEAAETLAERFDALELAVVCSYHLAQTEAAAIVETPNDGHAGEIETSCVLAVRPDLVDGTSPEEYPDFPRPFIARNKVANWPGGVWGNPAKATAEKGEKLFDICAERLAELIAEMKMRVEVSDNVQL